MKRIPLVVRLFFAASLGIALGLVLPDEVMRGLKTFQAIFLQLIKFLVPLIILGFVIPAIAETGRGAGRALIVTLTLAYVSTLFSGSFSYFVSSKMFPSLLSVDSGSTASAVKTFSSFFTLEIPPVADVLTTLILSFVVGLGIVVTKADLLLEGVKQFRGIVEWALQKLFVPILPLYIVTVMAEISASGRLSAIAGSAVLLALTALGITLSVLFVQYVLAGLFARRNPLKAFATMLPSYLTGWATCSSAATIPVSLRQMRKNDVSDETVNLVVPLCANIHLAGSMANIVAAAVAVVVIFGEPLSIGAFISFILMMSVVAVASPGVPGGCVVAAGAFVGSTLGFTEEHYALLVAFYMVLDGMGTACNLTGDGAIAIIVDKFISRNSSVNGKNRV